MPPKPDPKVSYEWQELKRKFRTDKSSCGLFLHKALMSGRLPKTIEMISINGIWEECLSQPLKVDKRDEDFIDIREAIKRQVMEAFAIPRYFNSGIFINGEEYHLCNIKIPKKDKDK